MVPTSLHRLSVSLFVGLAALLTPGPKIHDAHAQQAAPNPRSEAVLLKPSELRRLYDQLRAADASKTQGEPVTMETSENEDQVSGTLLAEIRQPYGRLRPLITKVSSLCEVMFMHVNVKACGLGPGTSAGAGGHAASGTQLKMGFGKRDETARDADNWVHFKVTDSSASADEAHIALQAAEGPMKTTDFRIVAQALAVGPQVTLLRFHYAYRSSRMARTAMATYLATLGRNKVGFTRTGSDTQGQPAFIGGVRGATERNMMRYFIAFDAAAAENEAANAANRPARLRRWFDHTERHARQLHELDWEAYEKQKAPGPDTSRNPTGTHNDMPNRS